MFVLSLLALGAERCSCHGEIRFFLIAALGTYEYIFGKGTSHRSTDEPCALGIIVNRRGSGGRCRCGFRNGSDFFGRSLFGGGFFYSFLHLLLGRYGKMLGSGSDLDVFIYRPCPGLRIFKYALGDIKGAIITIVPAYAHPVYSQEQLLLQFFDIVLTHQ